MHIYALYFFVFPQPETGHCISLRPGHSPVPAIYLQCKSIDRPLVVTNKHKPLLSLISRIHRATLQQDRRVDSTEGIEFRTL